MNKRYWLRGGLIFVAIHALVLLITIIKSSNATGPTAGFAWFGISFLDLPILTLLSGFLSGDLRTVGSAGFVVFVAGSVQWFFIGAILGWLYGKIKNKREVQQG